MTLRREMMKKNPAALSVAHVAKGIFYSRPSPEGEDNEMIAIRKEYEATGGKFIEHADAVEVFPGAWLSGPVPRKYPEHNWSVKGKVQTPQGLVGCRYALILCFRLFQVRQSKDCLRSEMSIYFPRATLPASYAERSV
jgi:hypothetical protein